MVFFLLFWSIIERTFRGIIGLWRFVWKCASWYINTVMDILQYLYKLNPVPALTALALSKSEDQSSAIETVTDSQPLLGKSAFKETESLKEEEPNSHDCGNLVRKRLFKAESEIQLLKSQITKEKVLWEGRFQELRRKQRELKEQLRSEVQMRTGNLSKEEINDIGFDRFAVNTADKDEVDMATDEGSSSNGMTVPCKNVDLEVMSLKSKLCRNRNISIGSQSQRDLPESQHSLSLPLKSASSRPSSSMSMTSSLGSPRSSSKPNRVFVPHSHLDLRIGHRVRVLLPSGRINTGIVRFLGYLNGMQDFCLGVELETPEYGQHDGVYEGQCYFHCKPGHGVFVSFNKLLMAWE
ncbi:centrosome-associated protein 350-like isoform X1 [Acipenser ruthenus]|uniref:centrosome-associated protein 350-like isoform X1 n=1 Tax=Acipenser ruthenus TaxID=7906 RepID=UPI0027419B82|nr:centrosome-associated protein 350-like isoform X1 [Acipenser ruthenus]XP_058855392.1 centrosome-associated protein 350-like isoform X1 [Acipenser ruthenus]